MTTPNRTHVWSPRWLTTLRLVAVLACLLLGVPAASAQPPPQHEAAVAAAPSLGLYLNPDGTLALPAGQAISLDPRGYRLVSGPGEAPRFAPVAPEATPGNENWASGISPSVPGTDGLVMALVADAAGNLYIGGHFTVTGSTRANNIAKWNGSTWFALGSGVGGCDGTDICVTALAIDAAGNLYAGGYFTTAGGVSADHIAKWDGTAWSPLGSGMDNMVWSLAVNGTGNLYAGGWFTTAGGVNANRIAKWDGTAWSALGAGVGCCVRAVAVDTAGNLYAGGEFATAGGVNANHIAQWDGTTWSALGSGMSGGDYPYVYALAFDAAGNLYAGGGFTTAGGVIANGIAKWDGTAWSALGSGMSNGDYPNVGALAFDAAGNLYAGGWFTSAGGVSANHIAKWDGTAWSALGSGMDSMIWSLAVDGTGNLYTGGGFTTAGGVSANYIAKWHGGTWSALGGGTSCCISAVAVDEAGNLYAGGSFTTIGGVNARRIAKWDGNTWSALGTGVGCCVRALAFDAAGNLYAGGDFTTAGGVSANRIAQWNGTAWSALGSGVGGGAVYGPWVAALACDAAGNLYAGGNFTTAGGISANHIAKWDGSTWSALGSGTSAGTSGNYPWVEALAFDAAGNLYAGGWFTSAGGVSANHIAQWDGTAWSPLGSGLNGSVKALATDLAGNLYAGGDFQVPPYQHYQVAQWDGTAWSFIGGYGSGGCYLCSVESLAIDAAGNLYAGSDFAGVGRISQWDGTTWHALGSGISGGQDQVVRTLAVNGAGNLYAGGDFSIAGNHVSAYVARWTAADGVRGVTTGSYTFYTNNLPVTIRVVTPGTLDRLTLQRFNRSHPQASPDLETGYYWEIAGTDANSSPASGYAVDLTLPTTFTPDADDRVCRYTGSAWDCAASAFTANSITRTGITQLSDWAVQDNIACADFDGDGTIDIDDLIAIATRWGQTSGTPGWDGRFDLRPDGRIDIVDIHLAAAQWGQNCSLF